MLDIYGERVLSEVEDRLAAAGFKSMKYSVVIVTMNKQQQFLLSFCHYSQESKSQPGSSAYFLAHGSREGRIWWKEPLVSNQEEKSGKERDH